MTTTDTTPHQPSRETVGGGTGGFAMLALLFVVFLVGLASFFAAITDPEMIFGVVAAAVAFAFIAPGFYKVSPNEAAAITLFGAYRGSDRTPGLRWTWP